MNGSSRDVAITVEDLKRLALEHHACDRDLWFVKRGIDREVVWAFGEFAAAITTVEISRVAPDAEALSVVLKGMLAYAFEVGFEAAMQMRGN